MPMNYYEGKKTPKQYSAIRSPGLVSQTNQTGYGGPVSTGLTGSGALVAYQSSPEPIATIPPVHVDLRRTNGFADYWVPLYIFYGI